MVACGRCPNAALVGLAVAWLAISGLALACGGASDGAGPTLVVNSTLDADARDDVLTLREALLLATGELMEDELDEGERGQVDGSPGAEAVDTVVFDESTFPQEEPATITLDSPLPTMSTGGDVVDGMGAVIIDGGKGTRECFTLGSNANELKGLRIHNCRTAVLVLEGAAGNIIGSAGEGNVLSGNTVGVEVRGEDTIIRGNIIGLDAAGATRMPNRFEGIWVTSEARDTVIGGAGPGEGNVISGNDLFGVSVDGAAGTVLQGNIIGLDVSGRAAVLNRYGITVQSGARETMIGGDTDEGRNVIAGNNTAILVRGPTTEGNVIQGNYFGTDIDGEQAIANAVDVWLIGTSDQNVVGDNYTLEPLNVVETASQFGE